MLILTAPAKTLELKRPYTKINTHRPIFTAQAEPLAIAMADMQQNELTTFLHASDAIGAVNYERMQTWQKHHTTANSRPSIFMFAGDIFKAMDVYNYTTEQLYYSHEHVLILSGLYGALRPLDLLQPYRLEMGSKSPIDPSIPLAKYWREHITRYINESLASHTSQLVLNLASKEYSDAIDRKILTYPMVNATLLQEKNGIQKTIAIYAKKARGQFMDYCITTNAQTLDDCANFTTDGYKLVRQLPNELVFVRTLS